MKFRFGLTAVAIAAVAGAIAVAEAQTNVAASIAARQDAMKAQGGAMRTLTPIVRGEQPWNQQAAVQAATTQNNTAKAIPTVFPQGSGPEAGKTDALPAIWQNWADFQAKAKALETESAKLLQLAQAGDEAGFKAQFPAVGRTCGGCHEGYRVKK
ncbi:MAG TPA: cytochrome c [Alphaproteobacteria bacterium]|nr:cytochrome c [Alphaproteobacteria bacterium]